MIKKSASYIARRTLAKLAETAAPAYEVPSVDEVYPLPPKAPSANAVNPVKKSAPPPSETRNDRASRGLGLRGPVYEPPESPKEPAMSAPGQRPLGEIAYKNPETNEWVTSAPEARPAGEIAWAANPGAKDPAEKVWVNNKPSPAVDSSGGKVWVNSSSAPEPRPRGEISYVKNPVTPTSTAIEAPVPGLAPGTVIPPAIPPGAAAPTPAAPTPAAPMTLASYPGQPTWPTNGTLPQTPALPSLASSSSGTTGSPTS